MSRVVLIVCAVAGLAVTAPVASGCPDGGDSIALADVDVALPITLESAVPRLAAGRWAAAARDTGRELSASIFRPPV